MNSKLATTASVILLSFCVPFPAFADAKGTLDELTKEYMSLTCTFDRPPADKDQRINVIYSKLDALAKTDLPELLAILPTEKWDAQELACQYFRLRKTAGVVPTMQKLLKNSNRYVAAAALQTTVAVGTAAEGKTVVENGLQSTDSELRLTAVQLINQVLPDPDANSVLIKVVAGNDNEYVKMAAVIALRKHHNQKALRALHELLEFETAKLNNMSEKDKQTGQYNVTARLVDALRPAVADYREIEY